MRAIAARFDSDRLVLGLALGLPVLALLGFFLYPLWLVVQQSLVLPDGRLGLGNYAQAVATARFWHILGNSLLLGVSTTALTLVLGFVIAHAVHRCRVPGKALLQGAVTLSVLAPSLVQGLGLILLLGRNGLLSKALGVEINIYGFTGLLIADTLYALPQAVLIIGAALRAADARLYEAAEIIGASPLRQFRDITVPGARFGLLSAGFVVFTVTITDFGNAAVIGGNFTVLATEIYNQAVGQMNFSLGAVIGVILLLPSVLAFGLEKAAGQRGRHALGDAAQPYSPVWQPVRDIPMTALAWAIGLASAAVVLVVVLASFVTLWPYNYTLTLRHYGSRLGGGYEPLWNSVLVSLIAAVAGMVLLFLLAMAIRRLPPLLAKPAYLVALLPASVPGLVLGLAYVFAFNDPDYALAGLYETVWLLAACNAVHYATQGFLAVNTGLAQVPASIEDSAECLGAGAVRRAVGVVGPILLPVLVSTGFFLFMRSMVTLSAVIFLVSPGLSLVSVSIMRLDEGGHTAPAAAFATVTMAVVIAASLLMRGLLALLARRGA